MVSSSQAFRFEGVDPEIEFVFLAMQAEAAIEYLRRQPAAPSCRHGFVIGGAGMEDLEVDGFASGVDQPVFRHSRSKVRLTQPNRVLADRTITDDFEHPVGYSLHAED